MNERVESGISSRFLSSNGSVYQVGEAIKDEGIYLSVEHFPSIHEAPDFMLTFSFDMSASLD